MTGPRSFSLRQLFQTSCTAFAAAMTRCATVCLVLTTFAQCGGLDLSKYQELREPRISQKDTISMLVTEMVGAPEQTAGVAFGALYGAYYGLDNATVAEAWPRSRWDVNLMAENVPMSEWRGTFAVPVAASVTQLPAEYAQGDPAVRLETWDYGLVAEILHVGPYNKMQPTIEKLSAYADSQGYTLVGPHEEEYLKGPGMIFRGDPDEYLTIIRYAVVR